MQSESRPRRERCAGRPNGSLEAACPKEIGVRFIARLNRDFIHAGAELDAREVTGTGGAG
jgi:hypothetical protein